MGEPTPPDSGKVIGGNVRVNKELFEHGALHIIQLKKRQKRERRRRIGSGEKAREVNITLVRHL